jgi:hypothetical protein
MMSDALSRLRRRAGVSGFPLCPDRLIVSWFFTLSALPLTILGIADMCTKEWEMGLAYFAFSLAYAAVMYV